MRRRSALRASGFPALTALVVVACIGVVGALYVRSERRMLRDQAEAQLAAIADLKVSQIEAWRGERLADGQAFSRLFAPRLAALRGRPSALLGELGPSLRLLTASYGYADALVVDLSGWPLATAGEAEPSSPIDAAERLGIALKRGALLFEVMGEGPAGLEIELVAPIFDPERPGAPLGGLVLRIDPRRVLFPMVKRWPTPSETGESLLVRIERDHVATLNEPRHRTPAAAHPSPPLDDPRHPAARIVRGDQGLVRGIDYRGVEVLAVGRRVPRSAWFVVAKVDVPELMAPARDWSIALGAVVLLLIGSGVAAVALWWRHQSALGERARFREAQRYHAFTRHLELLSEHADDVVLLVDSPGRIVRANERVREQYGWSTMELVGLDLRVLRAKGHENFQEHFERIRAEGRARYETVHRRRDGSSFPVEVSARSFEAEGRWYVQAIVRDVSERKRVLSELSYQAELLRNVYDAIIGLDADHVIRSWNAGAERMYGIGAAEAIGRPIAQLLPSEYKGHASWADFVDAVNGVDRMQFEVHRKLRDGRELDVEGAAVVLRDAERRITGYVTINRDVTERRRAREQLLHAQKMEAVGQLASGVAHDFNNLLVAILSCSEFLLESMEPSDPRRTDVEEIRQAGQRAAHLVRQLLAFARKGPSRPATVDLQEIVRGLEPLLRRTIGEDVALSFCLDPCLALIDAGLLEQVLMNLAVNARDAMPGGGRLHVETRAAVVEGLPVGTDGCAPGRYAVLTVSDTGCGIPPDVLPRIFEPFFTTKGAGRGTGLGLSTTYGIVQEAGGCIRVQSEPGRGTRFSVHLPAGDCAARKEPPAQRAPAGGSRGRRVLVVEDDELVRRVARRALEGGGYAVADLVLSDVVMPGRSGLELASLLEAKRPDMPVVLMSGYSESQRSRTPSRRFLEKPFTSEALLARIDEELRAAHDAARKHVPEPAPGIG